MPEQRVAPEIIDQKIGDSTDARMARLVRNVEANYFLCGPTRFMVDIQSDLERQGTNPERIHTETFGPAG